MAEAVAEVNRDRATLRKYWERTGCLLTADGSLDDLVHLHSTVALGPLPEASAAVDVEDVDEAEEELSAPAGLGLGEGKTESKEHKGEPMPCSHRKEQKEKEKKRQVKREDIDNVKHDDDELDLDRDSDSDPELPEIPLRDALAGEWSVISTPPAKLDATLDNSFIVLRWEVFGWALGKIVRFYSRKPKNNEYNYEVRWIIGSELRDHRLQLKDYSASDDASHGAWCLVRKSPSSSSSSSASLSSSSSCAPLPSALPDAPASP